jgi:hypothetical protein
MLGRCVIVLILMERKKFSCNKSSFESLWLKMSSSFFCDLSVVLSYLWKNPLHLVPPYLFKELLVYRTFISIYWNKTQLFNIKKMVFCWLKAMFPCLKEKYEWFNDVIMHLASLDGFLDKKWLWYWDNYKICFYLTW